MDVTLYECDIGKEGETDLVQQPNELHITLLLHSCSLKALGLCKALPNAEHVRSESFLEVGGHE